MLFKVTVVTDERIGFTMDSDNALRDAVLHALNIDIDKAPKGYEYLTVRFKSGWDVLKYKKGTSINDLEHLCYVYLKAVNDRPYRVE